MTQETPAAFMAMGACSLDEPQPKFLALTMISPGFIFFRKSLSASSMQCFASSAGSDVLRYLAGMIASVSISAPNLWALPFSFICNLSVFILALQYNKTQKENLLIIRGR